MQCERRTEARRLCAVASCVWFSFLTHDYQMRITHGYKAVNAHVAHDRFAASERGLSADIGRHGHQVHIQLSDGRKDYEAWMSMADFIIYLSKHPKIETE